MIKQLLIDKIHSHFLILFLYVLANTVFFVSFSLSLEVEDIMRDLDGLIIITAFIYITMIIVVKMSESREKRTRLYTQLPVSSYQIRIAEWSFTLLCLLVPAVGLVCTIVYWNNAAVTNMALATITLFIYSGVLLVSLSTILNQISKTKIDRAIGSIYLISALIIVFIFSCFVVIKWFYIINGGDVNWIVLAPLITVCSASLVTLDLYLYERKDNFLN